MANLTPKQELFVAEYLKDLNATQAAIRAGYASGDSGRQLLTESHVAERIAARRTEQLKRVEIDSDFVLRELFKLANLDLASAYDEHGKLRPIHEIPEDVRKAISAIEVEELYEGQGEERKWVGYTSKVKFWDKTRSLEMLGRHLALFKDKLEISADSALTDELRAARERAAAFDLI